MKKTYILIAAITVSTAVFAQSRDSLLRRQIELERDFNPTLFDTDKINSLPEVQEPVVQKANANYATWAGRINPPIEIALPTPADIMTQIPYDLKKGYLGFHAGNYANLDGALGYRLVENDKHRLSFAFLHNSSNGDVKYVQESDPALNKFFFMDNHGRIDYRHTANKLILDLRLSYLHSMFNYYGNTFGSRRITNNENQQLGIFNVGIGVQSQPSERFNYKGYLDYKNFTAKFAYLPTSKGINGNQFNAMAGIDKPFSDTNHKIGIDGYLYSTSYNRELDNYFLINAAPYLQLGGDNWSARLGVDVLFQIAEKMRVRVVPNLNLSLNVTEHSSLYADIHGGFGHNTYLDMMRESRYILPATSVKPSFTAIDLSAGAKIGEINGFRFDLFGGYRQTENEHFLIANKIATITGTMPHQYLFNEGLLPLYGTLSHGYLGGMIQTKVWAPLDLSLRLKKNFFTAKDIMIWEISFPGPIDNSVLKIKEIEHSSSQESIISDPKAYNKPGMEMEAHATLSALQNLKFTLDYFFVGDRQSYFKGENVKMENIHDLNIGAVYEINRSISLQLRANNVLFQKYDIWYGHPAQGFNASGGFTLKF